VTVVVVSPPAGSGQASGSSTTVPDLSASTTLLLASDLGGRATIPFAIPVGPALVGASFHAQAIVVDRSGPLVGRASVARRSCRARIRDRTSRRTDPHRRRAQRVEALWQMVLDAIAIRRCQVHRIRVVA